MTNPTTKATPIVKASNHNQAPQPDFCLCFKTAQEKQEWCSNVNALSLAGDRGLEFVLIQGTLFRIIVQTEEQSKGPKPARLEITVRS